MALTVTYNGTKDDLIAHLRSVAAEHTTAARSMSGQEKSKRAGMAEGLEAAAEILGQWQPPATETTESANGEVTTPAWSS